MQPAHQLRSAKCLNNHLRSEMIEKAKRKGSGCRGGEMRHLSSPITAHHALVRHVGRRRRFAEDGARAAQLTRRCQLIKN